MAKPTGVIPPEDVVRMFQIDLKNRPLAALLAWLWPGAGHLYQGRTAKGMLLMLCIMSTFIFGFYIGGAKVVYASPKTLAQLRAADQSAGSLRLIGRQALDRWQFLCQAGIGSVAIPAVVERQRFLNGGEPLLGGWFRPPKTRGDIEPTEDSSGNLALHADELSKWNYESGFYFELGSIYTVIAGLLNVLAIYDAYSGPLMPQAPDEPEEKPDEKPPA